MAYNSNYKGTEVDKVVKDVKDHDVIIKYGNIEGNIQNQTDLAAIIGSKYPIDHITDSEALPDSAEGDTVPTVPDSRAVRSYVQGRLGLLANKDLSNLSTMGKAAITYKAGVGITIDPVTRTITNESLSNWGSISGDISNQTDLQKSFGHYFREGDSIQDNLDTKQDKETAVTHKSGVSVGNSTTPVYVDNTGATKPCSLPIPAVTSSVIEGSTEVLTSGGAYTNLVRRSSSTNATGSPSQPVYVKEDGQVAPCTDITKSIVSVLEMIYPVGSIYLSVTSTCPISKVFGVWEKVSTDRVLQGSGAAHQPGSLIEAGLPNITGYCGFVTAPIGSYRLGGAFQGPAEQVGGAGAQSNNTWWIYNLNFNAAWSNALYGRSDTVQPSAYVVNVWRRTA